MAKFPSLQAFLSSERARAKRTIGDISEESGLATATVHAYLQGITFPAEDKGKRLAKGFYPDDKTKRDAVLERLNRMRQAKQDDVLTRLMESRGPLKVSFFHYPPFCHSGKSTSRFSKFSKRWGSDDDSAFLDSIARRFFLLAGIDLEGDQDVGEFDAIDRLENGDVDLVVSLFQNYNRARHFITFSSPLRTSLNAVCIGVHDPRELQQLLDPSEIGKAKKELGPERYTQYARQKATGFQFVAVKNQVGYGFLKDVVQLDVYELEGSQCLADSLEPIEWIKVIEKLRGTPKPIVAISDEFSALRLLCHLDPELQDHAGLLWPVSTATTAAKSKDGRMSAPLYPMGVVSINRTQKAFADYLRFGLNLMIRTDTEYLSDQFRLLYESLSYDLYKSLRSLTSAAMAKLKELQKEPASFGAAANDDDQSWCRATAIRIARFHIGLEGGPSMEMDGKGSLPWDAVLERAKEKIGPREEVALNAQGGLTVISRSMPFLFDQNSPWEQSIFGLSIASFRRMLAWPLKTETRGVSDEEADNPQSAAAAFEKHGHVLVGFFSTPRRAETWRFLPTPVRVPLNILAPKEDAKLKKALREEGLGALSSMALLNSNIKPIVHGSGSAYELLVDHYNATIPNDLVVRSLKPTAFNDVLKELEGSDRPVIVLDTLSILPIANSLPNMEIVFPNWPELDDRSDTKNDEPGVPSSDVERFCMPTFPLAIGVHRTYSGLAEQLEDMLRTYLTVEHERMVRLYLSAIERLQENIKPLISFQDDPEETSKQWVRRICSVDSFGIEKHLEPSNPWRRICMDVSEILTHRRKWPDRK